MSSTINGLSSPQPTILPPTPQVQPELERDRFTNLLNDTKNDARPAPAPAKDGAQAPEKTRKADTAPAKEPKKAEEKASATPPPDDKDDNAANEAGDIDLEAIAVQLQALKDANGGELPALVDLVDILSTIDINLKNGAPIDQALLDKLGTTIDALSKMLALAQGGGEAIAVEPDSLLGQFSTKLEGLAGALKGQGGELAAKLDALAKQLASGELDKNALATLGFDEELKVADTKLRDALGSLVQVQTGVSKQAAPFAAPSLKTPDDPALKVGATQAPVVSQPALETGANSKPVEKNPGDKGAQEQMKATFGAMAKAEAQAEAPSDAEQNNQPTITVGGLKPEIVAGNRIVQTAYTPPPSPLNMPHLAFEIVRHVQQGVHKFQIRIDPPEMGRVDVTIDIDKSGTVNARLVVEKAETLDLMQRDQRALERALNQAGLDSSKTNLEFSLKQNPFAQQDGGDGRNSGSPFRGDGSGANADEVGEIAPTSVYRGTASLTGVNLFV